LLRRFTSQFRDVIVNQVPNYGSNLRNDLLRSITRIWDNFFMLDAGKDVAFEIGRVYYATKEYAKALEFYTISSESFGEHHLTAHNIGLCYYSMSKLAESLKCFSRALSLNYDYEEVRSLLPMLSPSSSSVNIFFVCLERLGVGDPRWRTNWQGRTERKTKRGKRAPSNRDFVIRMRKLHF
jgi:tetratricopeptide (TPR) repeat protein